jgi:hypothetical protein
MKPEKSGILGNLSSHWLGTAFCRCEWSDTLKLLCVSQFFRCIASPSTLTTLANVKTEAVGSSTVLEHLTITWCKNLNVDHNLKTCIWFCTREHLCPRSLQICIGIHVLQACIQLLPWLIFDMLTSNISLTRVPNTEKCDVTASNGTHQSANSRRGYMT